LIVEVQVSDEDAVYLYTARNVSDGGMFIDAPVPLEQGTALQIEFKLPGGQSISTAAEVRWNTGIAAEGTRVRHPGMGVGFVGIEPGDAARLRSWIDDA
jgi:Tfp pilus assembly protein PilZ